MSSYLDKQGLSYLWSKIQFSFASKAPVTQQAAGLMTPQDKIKLDKLGPQLDAKVDAETLIFTKE